MASDLSDDECLEFKRSVANRIAAKLNAVQTSGSIAIAAEMIARRLVRSGDSLTVLRNNSPHDYAFDAASILRTIYDVMLQGLYILADPSKRNERAQSYLDFMDIERIRRIELMDASGTDLAKGISGSPARPSAEVELRRRFDLVKGKYLTKKGDLRGTWYSGSLRDLAKATGLEAEYELMQKFLSGVVHSSPLTLKEGPLVRDFILMNCHWRFAFRVLGSYANYKGIALDQTEKDLIASSWRNVFNAC